jgi:hypothetical protein
LANQCLTRSLYIYGVQHNGNIINTCNNVFKERKKCDLDLKLQQNCEVVFIYTKTTYCRNPQLILLIMCSVHDAHKMNAYRATMFVCLSVFQLEKSWMDFFKFDMNVMPLEATSTSLYFFISCNL